MDNPSKMPLVVPRQIQNPRHSEDPVDLVEAGNLQVEHDN